MNDLIIEGPLSDFGYGQVCKYLSLELGKYYDINFFPCGKNCLDNSEQEEFFAKASANNVERVGPRTPFLKVYHQNELYRRIGTMGKYTSYTFFEKNKLNALELNCVRLVDNYVVPSQWAKGVIGDTQDDNVYVISPGIDRTYFNENYRGPQEYNYRSNPDAYVILNVGKWEIRKGHDFIREAFNAAFTADDNVELWMMCDNPFIKEGNQTWQKYYKDSPLADKIKFIPRVKTHREVAAVMSHADLGFFPARAEGWNMELMEMMSMGKPVITTQYSAHTEYVNTKNSMLLHPYEFEPCYDGVFFNGEGEWMKLNEKNRVAAIDYLKHAFTIRRVVNTNGIETAKKFTWESAGLKMKELIQ